MAPLDLKNISIHLRVHRLRADIQFSGLEATVFQFGAVMLYPHLPRWSTEQTYNWLFKLFTWLGLYHTPV